MEDAKRQEAITKCVSLPKRQRKEGHVVGGNSPENSMKVEDLLHKVIGNHLILASIMKQMKFCDLVTCRLVNSFWKETAYSVLAKRTDLKPIDLRFCKQHKLLFPNSPTSRKTRDLQNLLEDPNTKHFPCHNFKIKGPLKRRDLQKFLSSPRCGGQIRNLHLNFTYFTNPRPCGAPDAHAVPRINNQRKHLFYLRKLLTKQAVNLNSLTLRTINSIYNSDLPTAGHLFPSPVVLPKLTHLQINEWPSRRRVSNFLEFRWLEMLLKAAPNLTSFATAGIRTETLKSLINVDKSHLLTEMIVDNNSSCPADDQLLSQFKLKKFTATSHICNDDVFIAETALRVLRLNSETLTSITLDLRQAAASLPTTEIFVNVKSFCLIALEKKPKDSISKISLQELFPNLETIRLEGNYNAKTPDYGNEANFPFVVGETMDQVKTLEIQHVCPVEWLQLLPQVFPGMTHLILENYWDFPRSGHFFWAFPSLNFMDLNLSLGVENLDPVFTGFHKKTCEELRERSKRTLGQLVAFGTMEIETEEEIQKMRVAPSIVQLKVEDTFVSMVVSLELRELRIKVADTDPHTELGTSGNPYVLEGRDWESSEDRWRPACRPLNVDLMSPVSFVYAFGMMPNLQGVDISLKPNETKFLPVDTRCFCRLRQLTAAL